MASVVYEYTSSTGMFSFTIPDDGVIFDQPPGPLNTQNTRRSPSRRTMMLPVGSVSVDRLPKIRPKPAAVCACPRRLNWIAIATVTPFRRTESGPVRTTFASELPRRGRRAARRVARGAPA